MPDGTVVDLGDLVRLVTLDTPPYEVYSGANQLGTLDKKIWQTDVVANNVDFRTDGGSEVSANTIDILPGGDDDPMNVTIISPVCGTAFNADEDITFEIKIEDDDDIIEGEIIFDGVRIHEFSNLNGDLVQFIHRVSTPGSYSFVVNANNTRGEKYSKTSNLIVYNSFDTNVQKYISACIGKPENFQEFPSNRIAFDASDTKALEYTGSGGATGGSFNWIGPDNIEFSWTFLYSNGQEVYCSGIGALPCPGDTSDGATKYNFIKVFPTVNDNYAFLTVSF